MNDVVNPYDPYTLASFGIEVLLPLIHEIFLLVSMFRSPIKRGDTLVSVLCTRLVYFACLGMVYGDVQHAVIQMLSRHVISEDKWQFPVLIFGTLVDMFASRVMLVGLDAYLGDPLKRANRICLLSIPASTWFLCYNYVDNTSYHFDVIMPILSFVYCWMMLPPTTYDRVHQMATKAVKKRATSPTATKTLDSVNERRLSKRHKQYTRQI